MSHPPETRLEFAKRVHAIAQVQSIEEVAALIDAWVQVRDAESILWDSYVYITALDNLLDTIADLERQRDTAYTAAIQAAAERIRGIAYDELVDAVLTLIPADAQRLYNLRIAEAVRDEAKTAHDLDWRSWPSHRCLKKLDKSSGWSCQRLASASAEVERLKERL